MFSGGDSSDGISSLNQLGAYGFVNQVAVSKAVAAGQNIDWAQLAQQWIQMRDNTELETKTAGNTSAYKAADSSSNKFEEKGEADMDMDDEEQADDKIQSINDFASTSSVHNNLNQSWLFGESNSQIAPPSNINNQWNPWANQKILPQPLPNQSTANNVPTNPTAHIPSLLKITVPHPNEIRVMRDIPNQPDNASMMDAAKRKGLPAWIREGLEKMEREKQKQLEKEQKNKHMNPSNEDNTFNKNNLINSMDSLNGPATILDEQSTDNEETVTMSVNSQIAVNLKKDNEEEEDDVCSSPGVKTYEQQLADVMIAVRRTLTELLLEATNEEISKVAEETIKIFKSKASSAQVVRKSALSTLTGKLGLAAYGDSSSETDSDNDEHDSSKKITGQSESASDSEEQIRNVIRLKRRGFIKTSEEIEERVSLAAAREEEKLKYCLRKEEEDEREHNRKKHERSLVKDTSASGHSGHNIFKGYEKDFGEITETKIQHLNGKRQKERSNRKERITRFSDNKDKYVTLPNAATFLINSATNFGSGNNNTTLPTNSQRQNIPDINGLLPNYTSTGMTNVLNAADAALEKALKGKSSTSPEKQSRRQERHVRSYNQPKKRRLSESKNSRSRSKSSSSSTSSSSSSTSLDSDSSSTSRSSHHSKYKHRSAKKQKSHTSADRQYEKSNKSHRGDRKYSSFSYEKRDRESTRSRNHRSASSDSEDEYRRRHRNSSHHSHSSSQTRSYTSSRRARDREHSRSKSRSYSSNNRRQ